MATLPKIVVEGGPIVYGYQNPNLASFARMLSAKILAGPTDKIAQWNGRTGMVDSWCKKTVVKQPIVATRFIAPSFLPLYPWRYSSWTHASPYIRFEPAPTIMPGNCLVLCPGDDIVVGWDNTAYLAHVAALKTYLAGRRAKGWFVVVCTVLPRVIGAFPAFVTWQSLLNAEIRTWVAGGHCHSVCDLAAHPIIGPSTAPLNTAYYISGIYPTVKCHSHIRNLVYDKLKSHGRI